MEVKLLIENKINEAYLRMIFCANKTGPVKITRAQDVGRYIVSLVRYAPVPQKQTIGTELILPKYPPNKSHNRFCYLTIEDQDKINDYINTDFRIWFKTSMVIGKDELKLTYSDTIEFIIDKLKLKDEPGIYESLKKYDYRRRQKVKDFLLKSIQTLSI